MTDWTGFGSIWKAVEDYLTVDVKVMEEESGQCLVEFTVTNKTLRSSDSPHIVFEEVRLRYGTPPDMKEMKSTDLGGGQSFTQKHLCEISDLINMTYSVEGRLSPSALLEFRGRSNSLPRGSKNPLSPSAYVHFLQGLDIYGKLERILANLRGPTPETTLAQVQGTKDALSQAITEIRAKKEQIQSILGFVGRGPQDAILNHKQLVDEYIKRADEGLTRLNQSLASSDARRFDALRETTINQLKVEKAALDKATEEFSKKYAA
jgi:hypothetical protein